ncbi:hypothetical protein [Dysosmobacter sp.]|uniref:hypothetical protein n=1 Tax=Dysosmobacter sp. TaxID=2591382 RepID=UPI003FD8707C
MSYWDDEKPVVADTGKNVIELYQNAGKLAISRPSWTDDAGEVRRGKTVVLDLGAVKTSPEAVQIVKTIAGSL